jgi:ABC-type Fe3+ transport system permease subunit
MTGVMLLAEAALLGAVAYRSLRPVGTGGWGGAWGSLLSPTTTLRLGLPVVNAVSNTLLFAVGASVLTLLLGIAAGYSVAHRRRRAALVGVVLFIPLLLSPIVLSLALTQFWPPLLGGGGYVWALVIFSQTVLALPFALQSIEIPLTGIPTDASDAARTLGATGWTAYLDVDLPRVRDGLVTAGLFALALGMGEFTATNYLVTLSHQYTTLPVALYNLYSTRYVGLQDAVAGLLLLISLATFVALSVGGRRVEL